MPTTRPVLYGLPVSEWVLRTALAMEATHATDTSTWAKHWANSYSALGGRSSSGSKGCPRSAAYALWYLGWLKGSTRPPLDWPIQRIAGDLGKNAAYAVIAARLLTGQGFAQPHSALWRRVRQEFRRETGHQAAHSEQGAAKVAVGLFMDGMIVALRRDSM